MMSGLYPSSGGMQSQDPSAPHYPMYGAQYVSAVPQLQAGPSHLEGAAFWYRRDISEVVYDPDSTLSERGPVLPGLENAPKHRRTRSGCFTCRSRRVKCDETRPVCDRCRKGNRECEFPQPSASKRSKHAESKTASSPQKQDLKNEEFTSTLDVIKDESEEDAVGEPVEVGPVESHSPGNIKQSLKFRSRSAQSLRKRQQQSPVPDSSTANKDKVSSPSTGTSSPKSRSQTPASSLDTSLQPGPSSSTVTPVDESARTLSTRWTHLSAEFQKYLEFQRDHLTFYHYFWKLDPTDYVHTGYIDLALTHKPLLYAVVAFAAYHYTLQYHPSGNLSSFLTHYSNSLSLLRKWLGKHPNKYSDATILTILQLATLEDYLGDWVNLVGHHRAAYHMLIQLYTPEPTSIMATETSRMILSWYSRFDITAGLMAGKGTILDRSWYEVCQNWYYDQIDPEDLDLDNTFQYIVSASRLIGRDMAMLFAKIARQDISIKEFLAENSQISDRITAKKRHLLALNDSYYTLTEFPYRVPLNEADIVDPYIPGGLFVDALWPLNFLWADTYAMEQMHRQYTSRILRQPIPEEEFGLMSLEQARIYEAVDRYPEAPRGSILGLHSSLGMSALFLKKDRRHIEWVRRKLCQVERMGYQYPPAFRRKMAELWDQEEVAGEQGWWLTDEEIPPILKEIRKLGEERKKAEEESDPAPVTGGSAIRSMKDGLRDVKAIFSKLTLRKADRASTANSPGTISSGGDEDSPRSDQTLGSAASEVQYSQRFSPPGIQLSTSFGGPGNTTPSGSDSTQPGPRTVENVPQVAFTAQQQQLATMAPAPLSGEAVPLSHPTSTESAQPGRTETGDRMSGIWRG